MVGGRQARLHAFKHDMCLVGTSVYLSSGLVEVEGGVCSLHRREVPQQLASSVWKLRVSGGMCEEEGSGIQPKQVSE